MVEMLAIGLIYSCLLVMNKTLLSLSATLAAGAMVLAGCGQAPSSAPTNTVPATDHSMHGDMNADSGMGMMDATATMLGLMTGSLPSVSACKVFATADLQAAFPGSTPTTTSDDTPKPGFSEAGNTYSNCHWDLKNGATFDLHVETFTNNANAKGIVVSNLAEDRVQGAGRFEYVMEPSLGAEAYFRLDRSSAKLSVVKGNSFYDLNLSGMGNLDSNQAKEVLKGLVGKIQ